MSLKTTPTAPKGMAPPCKSPRKGRSLQEGGESTAVLPKKPAPGVRRQVAITKASERIKTERSVRLKVVLKDGLAGSPHSDEVGHVMEALDTLGTTSQDFLADQLGNLKWASGQRGATNGAAAEINLNSSLAVVGAIAPRDELEAALAVQMVGVHNLTTEMLGRAKATDRTDHIQLYGGLAVKLSRTFVAQVEALAKLRSAGKQTVEVIHVHKHVYVAPGGQAIVGDVHHRGGGGGQPGNAAQPHARALGYAPGLQMPGANPPWDLVPSSEGEGAEAMQDARRSEG